MASSKNLSEQHLGVLDSDDDDLSLNNIQQELRRLRSELASERAARMRSVGGAEQAHSYHHRGFGERYLFGNALNVKFVDRPEKVFVPLHILFSMFRAAGQVIFMNNPWTGLLVFVAMLMQDAWMCCLSLVCTLSATVCAMLLGLDRQAIADGIHGFNACIAGAAVAVFMNTSAGFGLSNAMLTVLLGLVCVLLQEALANTLKPSPALTLPFNLSVYLVVLGAFSYQRIEGNKILPQQIAYLPHEDPVQLIFDNYAEVFFRGIVCGIGQIWFVGKFSAALIILIGVCLCSPLTALLGLFGSMAGAGTAIALGADPALIANGLFSYNGALVAISLGGMFFCFSVQSVFLALLGTVLSVVFSGAVAQFLVPFGLTQQTLPFCLSVWVILAVNRTLKFPTVPGTLMTFPERIWIATHARHDGDAELADHHETVELVGGEQCV